MIVDLDEAKAHLSMTHDADDVMIMSCIEDAEAYASQFMDRPLDPWDAEGSPVPPDVCRAIKMLIGEFYEQRTQGVVGTIYAKLPHVEQLLHFHRKQLGV